MKYPDFKKEGGFKISGPCKSAAKSKFAVYPSAYANAWGVKCTKAGGPGSMGKSKKQKGGESEGTVLAERTPRTSPVRGVGRFKTQKTSRKQVVQNDDGTYEIRKTSRRQSNRELGDYKGGSVGSRRRKAEKIAARFKKKNEKGSVSRRQTGGEKSQYTPETVPKTKRGKNLAWDGTYKKGKERKVMESRNPTGRNVQGKRRRVNVEKNKQVVYQGRKTAWKGSQKKGSSTYDRTTSSDYYDLRKSRDVSKSKTVSKKRAERVAARINRKNERKTKTKMR